jgi:hypothetical protein
VAKSSDYDFWKRQFVAPSASMALTLWTLMRSNSLVVLRSRSESIADSETSNSIGNEMKFNRNDLDWFCEGGDG